MFLMATLQCCEYLNVPQLPCSIWPVDQSEIKKSIDVYTVYIYIYMCNDITHSDERCCVENI